MDTPPNHPGRILVVARPTLGRRIEVALRSVGHEVHRTPDPSATESLAARLRPGAVVVALDLPWGDAYAAAQRLRAAGNPMPVLLLGNEDHGASPNGFAHLPLEADAGDLQAAVADLLAPSPDGTVHHQ